MSHFTLCEYSPEKSNTALGKINFLKKNCTSFNNPSIKPFLVVFENGLGKIKGDYINEMKKIYKLEEEFYFLVPVSTCDYFVNKIKQWISNEFANAVDISSCFTENQPIDMARLGTNAEESLTRSLVISNDLINNTINKLFIADDVYSTGTSIRVYKNKIQELFNNEIEFSYGTLIKTQ
ncbi:hypothetical protein [Flavobacterium sp. 120]|uniref:hypothetical protein n=1 Tax=Flavobacterium sp. 120 TaxID=2135626 RepID=UPI000EACBBF5|nr:hypothetical protein [Flavobacterium sp. 120]RKS12843.1 hypothetical protein C8C87_0020 [Flavobacterium sp. 120]